MSGDAEEHSDGPAFGRGRQQTVRSYVRFVALGDSASCGVGDPTPDGWRGWARLLADAIAVDHHVSFCNLAVSGATVADVRRHQLSEALDHRPVIASLIVGLNDVVKSTWDPERLRADLLHCADALASQGVLVVTVRFHDHSRVFGLPRLLAEPVWRRIQVLNAIYDEIHELYGAFVVDLADDPTVCGRELWTADRLHPSELGHRRLARLVGEVLIDEGLEFDPPSLTCDGTPPSRRDHALVLTNEVVPWLARRFSDLVPWVAQEVVQRMKGLVRAASR